MNDVDGLNEYTVKRSKSHSMLKNINFIKENDQLSLSISEDLNFSDAG